MKRLLFMFWLHAPAFACNCIAKAGNHRVLNAYMLMTLILMALPTFTLFYFVRQIRAWEQPAV
ncbi:MAG: hypothetical protein U0931_30230 [Vulcanimicrobiota bacterium]